MNQQPTGSFGSGKQKGGKRLWFMVAGAVVVLLLIGSGVYAWVNSRSSDNIDQTVTKAVVVCDSKTNVQANQYLNGSSTDPLAFPKLAGKVATLKDFDKDPNCLYILINYNLAKNISQGNDEYIAKLNALYASGAGLDPVFQPRIGIDKLKQTQEALKGINELQEKSDGQADKDSMETQRYVDQL